MPDANLTEIVCVLDRSGSMAAVVDDAIGGFNTMLADQQAMKDGEARMTIVLFDHEYAVVVENAPVAKVKPLNCTSFAPRGSTALLDAVGRTIDDTGKRLAALPDEKRPGKLLFVILTDGHENCSSQYTHERVAGMIKHQTEQYQWTFMYLSAELNAFDHARNLNIGTSVRYTASSKGTRSSYGLISSSARQYRSGGAQGMSIMDSCVDLANNPDFTVDDKIDGGSFTDSTTDSDSGS